MLFKPNPSSGVPIYHQLMEQVKHSVETGALRPGEQLPGIRPLAEALVINPNTVAKAYRELEHAGLVQARPGIGTFVRRSLAPANLSAHGPLKAELAQWMARARRAGLDDESIEALFRTTFREAARATGAAGATGAEDIA